MRVLACVCVCVCGPPWRQVRDLVKRARDAQVAWARTSFGERRRVLKMINKFILANQDAICRESMRDSGKTRTCPLSPSVCVCALFLE